MKGYLPQREAREIFRCRDREILADGPVRTGKTRAILEKMYVTAVKYPGCRILLARAYRASLTQSALQTFETDVLGGQWPAISNPGGDKRYRESYKFENGSEIVLGGLDHVERLMSTEFDRIAIFEATELKRDEPYHYLLTRLSGDKTAYTQLVVDANPGPPTHWLWARHLAGDTTRIRIDHRCNPRWWNEDENDWTEKGRDYVLGTLQRGKGSTAYRRLVLGEWVASQGLVFECFDIERHVREKI